MAPRLDGWSAGLRHAFSQLSSFQLTGIHHMARSLTVTHQESPSSLFAVLLIVCAVLLLLGATFGSAAEAPADQPPMQATAH
jgi:hypothetical protein